MNLPDLYRVSDNTFSKQFTIWPKDFCSKGSWAWNCREIIPGQNPVAQHGEYQDGIFVADANLYHFSQTRPMEGRKYALQRLVNIIYPTAFKDTFAIQHNGEYSTRHANPDRPFSGLSPQNIKNHFNDPEKSLHLRSTDKTQWMLFDLDCHEGIDDPLVFLDRVEKLLEFCHGDGWHYEIVDSWTSGIHIIKIFDAPYELKTVHKYADQILSKCGLSDLGIEVYPTKEKTCRCPGDASRLLILDKIIEPVIYRKKRATDVEYYLDWLEDPNRQYPTKNRILSILQMNLRYDPYLGHGRPKKVAARRRAGGSSGKNSLFTNFKGHTWDIVTDFWSGRHCPRGSLDEVLPVTIRVAHSQGYNDDEIIQGIRYLCKQLPDHARDCSSRLEDTSKARMRLIRDIEKKVKYMSDGGGQRNPQKSKEILSKCKWKGDVFDPSTWTQPKTRYELQSGEYQLSDDDLAEIGTEFVGAFPKKYRQIVSKRIKDIISAMAKLTAIKSKEENGISHTYWQKFFLDQFHLDMKLTNLKVVLKAARKCGVIKMISKLGRTNVYQPGSLFSNSSGSILLVVKNNRKSKKELYVMEKEVARIIGRSGDKKQRVINRRLKKRKKVVINKQLFSDCDLQDTCKSVYDSCQALSSKERSLFPNSSGSIVLVVNNEQKINRRVEKSFTLWKKKQEE